MSLTASDVQTPHPSPSNPGTSRMPWMMRILVALPVVLLAGFAVIATAIPAIQVRELSILDEAAHIDSIFKVPSIDRSGEKFLPETLDQVSCRGGIAQWPDWEPPPCGIPQGVPPANYQVGSGGYNTADIHPPIYYFVTAGLTAVGGWFVVDADPVTLMRLTGGVYLAVGVCLTWLLARRVGANRWAAFGAAGLLVTAPNVLYMSSIVNVDASVVMAAAAFGLVALAVWRRKSAWWALPLLAMGLMLVKMTNLGALIATALFLIITEATAPFRSAVGDRAQAVTADSDAGVSGPPDPPAGVSAADPPQPVDSVRETDGTVAHVRRRPGESPSEILQQWRSDTRRWSSVNGRGTWRAVGLSALMALGAVVVTLGWSRIQYARALVPADELWFTRQFKVDRLLVGDIGNSLLRFWEPTGLWPTWLARPYLGSVLLMITAAVPFGLMVAAWFRRRAVYPILLSVMITMAIAAPVYVVMNYVVNGVYFNPDFRYGLSVLPFFAAAVAAGLRTRLAGAVVAALAVIGMVTTLMALT